MSDPLAGVAELPGVSIAVEEARTAVDRLYAHRMLRRRGPEVSAESALRGARASAALEGASVSLGSLRDGSSHPVIQGALRVSAALGALGTIWRGAPRQALAKLHALAALDAVPDNRLGRPRANGTAADPLDLGPPPSPTTVAARIDGLVGLLTAETKAPAIVVAAVAHAELAVLRPFGSLDGVVARAAERLTLVERGLDPKSLAVVEAGHLELGPAYAESLRGYVRATSAGVGGWVRHCADAVILGARESLAVCEALTRA